jgi:hypothetical protein
MCLMHLDQIQGEIILQYPHWYPRSYIKKYPKKLLFTLMPQNGQIYVHTNVSALTHT